jgi:hypothetical protein
VSAVDDPELRILRALASTREGQQAIRREIRKVRLRLVWLRARRIWLEIWNAPRAALESAGGRCSELFRCAAGALHRRRSSDRVRIGETTMNRPLFALVAIFAITPAIRSSDLPPQEIPADETDARSIASHRARYARSLSKDVRARILDANSARVLDASWRLKAG